MLAAEVSRLTEVSSPSELGSGFGRVDAISAVSPVAGIEIRAVSGAGITLSFVSFAKDAVAPVHTHPHEQMGTVLEGEMEFEIAGERRVLRPGEVYSVPPNVPHGARAMGGKPCVALDAFTPRREDFMALARGVQAQQPAR